jgi:hypothetical protein
VILAEGLDPLLDKKLYLAVLETVRASRSPG